MNNKIFAGLAIFLLFLVVGTLFLFTIDAYYKTIYREKLSIEEVLKSDSLQAALGVDQANTPADLNLEFQTVQYNSFDGTALQAWYIAAEEPSNRCIILSHDIISNKLEALKFLSAFKKAGIHKKFHLFVPDLRNAGASESAPIFMGYKIAEDIATSITLLKEKFNLNTFTLFGIGLGATASAIAAKRTDLQQHYQNIDIEISGIILDSPVSHVEKELTKVHKKVAPPLASAVCFYFNNKVNGYLEYMRLSFLLTKTDYGALIFQNIGDETTPTPELLEEIRDVPSVKLEIFDGVEHAKIIEHPGYKARYIQSLVEFLDF